MCHARLLTHPILQDASNLTEYAVVFRYLDAPREPDEDEARAAIGTAEQVVRKIAALVSMAS